MASRLRFGAAALLIVAGAICALAIGGVVGDALGIGLVAVGLVAVVSLVFYEIGLGEDRDRERRR
jgi:O-antigen/teichoic acid export membrane protein